MNPVTGPRYFPRFLSWRLVVTALYSIPSILISATISAAETEYVVANEYVITTSPLKVLQNKAAELISEVDDIAVKESQNRYLLVTTTPEIWEADFIRSDQVKMSLCKKIARRARGLVAQHRVTGQRSGSISALRLKTSYACDENAALHINGVPNDPLFGSLWGMNQSNNYDIDAPEAWDIQTGSSNIVIAIVDTGIDYNHPDLAANMWVNSGEIPNNNIDDDNNGYIDDIHGINAITGTGIPLDDQSHGTHCAGTIGARGNNSIGLVGVSHQVKLMATKFLSSTGSGTLYDAVKSLDYINMMKSRGINIRASSNSWGGGGFYQALYDAISRSRDRDILFIAAAGNNSSNITTYPSYPASYQLENVVSVASTDESGAMSYFSNFGPSVSIAAPGSNIYSTIPGGGYAVKSGTSMATPHVSGVVALIASQYPTATYLELKYRLLNGARQLTQLNGITAFGRFLNAHGALTSSNQPPFGTTPLPTTPTPIPSTPTPGPTPTPTVTPTPTPSVYFFTGTIYNQTNTIGGISGAKVTITLNNNETRVSYSNSNGDYAFDNLPAGQSFQITREKSGYTINSSSGFVNANYHHVAVGAQSTYTVSGRVLDRDNQPLYGVIIRSEILGARTTDTNGYFSYQNILHGTSYNLNAEKSGQTFPLDSGQGFLRGDIEHLMIANTGM